MEFHTDCAGALYRHIVRCTLRYRLDTDLSSTHLTRTTLTARHVSLSRLLPFVTHPTPCATAARCSLAPWLADDPVAALPVASAAIRATVRWRPRCRTDSTLREAPSCKSLPCRECACAPTRPAFWPERATAPSDLPRAAPGMARPPPARRRSGRATAPASACDAGRQRRPPDPASQTPVRACRARRPRSANAPTARRRARPTADRHRQNASSELPPPTATRCVGTPRPAQCGCRWRAWTQRIRQCRSRRASARRAGDTAPWPCRTPPAADSVRSSGCSGRRGRR
eukprot:ctg_1038.g375